MSPWWLDVVLWDGENMECFREYKDPWQRDQVCACEAWSGVEWSGAERSRARERTVDRRERGKGNGETTGRVQTRETCVGHLLVVSDSSLGDKTRRDVT